MSPGLLAGYKMMYQATLKDELSIERWVIFELELGGYIILDDIL